MAEALPLAPQLAIHVRTRSVFCRHRTCKSKQWAGPDLRDQMINFQNWVDEAQVTQSEARQAADVASRYWITQERVQGTLAAATQRLTQLQHQLQAGVTIFGPDRGPQPALDLKVFLTVNNQGGRWISLHWLSVSGMHALDHWGLEADSERYSFSMTRVVAGTQGNILKQYHPPVHCIFAPVSYMLEEMDRQSADVSLTAEEEVAMSHLHDVFRPLIRCTQVIVANRDGGITIIPCDDFADKLVSVDVHIPSAAAAAACNDFVNQLVSGHVHFPSAAAAVASAFH